MEIYVFQDQLVLRGKVKDLMQHLKELTKEYHTVQELIKAHLH